MSARSDSPLLADWGRYKRPPRRSLPRWFWLLVAASIVGFSALGVWIATQAHPWHPPSGAPAFRSCTYGGYVNGWCASVRVPEDPRRPAGQTIVLHVAVLPATSRPSAGALFYLEGGPGGAATASAIRVNAMFAAVGRTRDLVMVDQRGTGGSGPACPRSYVHGSDAAAVTGYVRRCLRGLKGEPQLDTTSVAADDLEAVRRALGYGRIDLYGGSYGATLAQVYLRRHPASVRTVVLDSGSLPDVRLYDVSPRNAERALDAQFARCAAQPACAHAYPHPRRQLSELLTRPPRAVTLVSGRVVMRPDDVAWTVFWLSETAEGAALIPFALDSAVHGNYRVLAGVYTSQLGGSNLDPLARVLPFWEILCSEPWGSMDPGATARDGSGSYLGAAALARARLFGRACRAVPKGRVPPASSRLEAARAHVLLLTGGDDPLDPVANLRGWRRAFPNGRLVVVPGAGHGTIQYPCVQKLVARFVDRGTATGIDASCVRHLRLPSFVVG
jgi:pimeloyl-ACP methyl ester carboxylesterase